MIDIAQFSEWMAILGTRFQRDFSGPSAIQYHETFSDRLSTEQFTAAAKNLFEGDATQFPTPPEFVKLARILVPDRALPAAPEPKAYTEMTPEEQAEYRAAIAKFRAQLPSSAFARVGGAIARTALTQEGRND